MTHPPPAPESPTPDALTARAFGLFWDQHYAEALAIVDAALNLDPACVRAYLTKTVTLVQLGRPREARAFAEEAIRLQPDYGVAYSILAYCLSRDGDRPRAVANFERALTLSPEDCRVYYNYACYWADMGRPAECARWLEAGLRLEPGMAKNLLRDPDFARYAQDEWLRDLVAEYRARELAQNK